MKQNVNATVTIAILFVAFIIFFLVFSNRPAPEELPSVPLPFAPEVSERELSTMYRGLAPLGMVCVVTPLTEDRMKGVRVAGVVPDSPADRAGLQPADLITQFAGMKVATKETVMYLLTKVDPKKSYPIVVDRSGQQLTLEVTGIVPLPPEEQVRP